MGPRVALTGQIEPQVFELMMSFVEPEFVPFNTSRVGLAKFLNNEVQRRIAEYAARPVPPLRDWVKKSHG